MNQQSQAIYALLRHIHSYPCILFGLAHLDICWFHTPCKDLGENRRRFHEHKNLNLCFVPLNIVITTESKVVKLKAACLHKYRDLFAIQLIFQILISTIQRVLPYLYMLLPFTDKTKLSFFLAHLVHLHKQKVVFRLNWSYISFK